MPTTVTQSLISNDYILIFTKGAILLILIFYAIFSLIIVRQVDLMSKTLITRISPLLRAIAIVHAGLAIGFIILAWGIL
ncbi:MAG: hypothetical protein PHE48_00325 [Candidatus Daviesbacteria bacterium]|nr:hypothetical protein [Candidatus Daviesbacteria bacterium]